MQAILDILAEKQSMKKTEVVSKCKAMELDISDSQLIKWLKEICVFRGSSWILRKSK